MKLCPRCQHTKALDQFAKRPNGKPVSYCKPCAREYQREHYSRNPEPYKAKAHNSRVKNAQRLRDYKEAAACADCGIHYPYFVLDFDHRDPTIKSFNVASMPLQQGAGWERIMREIEKCDLVCANCHRFRTHSRRRSTNG